MDLIILTAGMIKLFGSVTVKPLSVIYRKFLPIHERMTNE